MFAEITLRGQPISQDEYGFLSLTDMWKIGSQVKTKAPRFWRVLPTTRELLAVVNVDARFSCVIEKTPEKSAIYSRKGRNAQTYAHVILALAYAEYLNPELGIEVREIALRVYAGDVTVLDEFKRTKREQIEDDGNRVMTREEIRRNNYELNQHLKHVGATIARQYAAFHDSGYKGLYDGMTENDIHSMRELKKNEAILDHMGFEELAANMFRTANVQQYLRKYPVESVMRACFIHQKFGEKVRAYLIENGLDCPEDLPVYPNIRDSYKRLRQLEKEKG